MRKKRLGIVVPGIQDASQTEVRHVTLTSAKDETKLIK